ncbi:hypothetical protein IEQ34_010017 [Dendrobium chrysotoxum]|uniref:Uncharacterized protein n=1 Tax=Dendrobium chrysotoxum TaxID=161865 RepID=A0AAV7H2C7_DENCH|nr:hypothetical protein IEQ34_010017 [Dendrobium chrysotoxum]
MRKGNLCQNNEVFYVWPKSKCAWKLNTSLAKRIMRLLMISRGVLAMQKSPSLLNLLASHFNGFFKPSYKYKTLQVKLNKSVLLSHATGSTTLVQVNRRHLQAPKYNRLNRSVQGNRDRFTSSRVEPGKPSSFGRNLQGQQYYIDFTTFTP